MAASPEFVKDVSAGFSVLIPPTEESRTTKRVSFLPGDIPLPIAVFF
jgi:hypothetical protein